MLSQKMYFDFWFVYLQLDDMFCNVKSLIKESFSIILEREMQAVYDDIW